jgi:hypothetical protein
VEQVSLVALAARWTLPTLIRWAAAAAAALAVLLALAATQV